ncbi:MAG TPA: alkaline phosphatase family protein [Planctomycetota bacterium]|nr:alkaline phosphatase family protein [Planctomycetota bacterium]
MAKRPSKVVVIGFDAPIVKTVRRYIKAGKLPNLARLCRRGVWGNHCLVPHPTITPPNWTTIVTGAWLGTHGVTCFNVHKPGDPLLTTHQGFFAEDVQAEVFWNAAAREGKRAIVMNYPTTYGRSVRNGIRIAGAGLGPNEWRTVAGDWAIACSAAADTLFTTEPMAQATPIEVRPARGWKNAPSSAAMLEADLPLPGRQALVPLKPTTWHLLLAASKGTGLDTAYVCPARDAKTAFARLRLGSWSDTCTASLRTAKGTREVVFRLRLTELAPDGSKVKLYVTPLCQTSGWATPASTCGKLRGLPGLPLPNTFYPAHNLGWIDSAALLDLIDAQNTWLGAAASRLLKAERWDIFVMHAHCPDHCYHAFLNKLDPDVCPDRKTVAEYRGVELGFYQSLDRMVGTILKATDPEETLVVITSDHGAVPTAGRFEKDFKGFGVGELLTKAGLTAWKKDRKTGKDVVDWSKTKAVAQRSVYVYVNLKGRDPGGIVKPADCDAVCDEVIRVLYDYTDPRTGKKPIAFALKKSDARIIGLYGDYVGDVVYGVHADVAGEHGRQLTTGDFGVGDMHGLFLMAGPGVRKGVELNRTVWLTDIVPTLCYLTGFPVPAQAEGAVLYQALTEPNLSGAAEARLRKELAKLQAVSSAERSLTHTYEA